MVNKLNESINFYLNTEEFNAAVSYTAERTGFSGELIEKDYLCSLVLMFLNETDSNPLIFKGGTMKKSAMKLFFMIFKN